MELAGCGVERCVSGERLVGMSPKSPKSPKKKKTLNAAITCLFDVSFISARLKARERTEKVLKEKALSFGSVVAGSYVCLIS